ncbi:hypothetical protein PTKIN_Ptkin09bG0157500 [Pterospermum kingtungense]
MGASASYMLLFLVLVCSLKSLSIAEADPTSGFVSVPLTQENFELQRPYDVPLEEHYTKFYKKSCITSSGMLMLQGLDYSSGVWQFEGYGFVPNGTSGVTISQIHGASTGATTLILRIYDGNMRYYSGIWWTSVSMTDGLD